MNLHIYDISLTNIVLPFLILTLSFLLILNLIVNYYKIIPDNWQIILEKLYLLVINIIKEQTNSRGYKYFPFMFSLFHFVFLMNLLSMTPFGIALTSHIIIIGSFSFSLWLSIFLLGLAKHNTKFLKIFIPEAPFILLLLLIPIEMFSYLIRAFSLAIRLSANIMAGHTLVYIISGFVIKATQTTPIYIFLILFLFAIFLLEFGVAFIQAYVLTILTCIYINDSLRSPQQH